MKRLKIFLSITALMLGLGGAVAAKVATMPKANEQTYDWMGNGPNHSGSLTDKTIREAEIAYGCEVPDGIFCAKGSAPGVPDVQLLKSP